MFDLIPSAKAPFLIQAANSAWLEIMSRKNDQSQLISYSELKAYIDLTGADLDKHDVTSIMQIDATWCQEIARQKRKKMKPKG